MQLILSVCENTILASPRATRVRLPNWREAVLGLHDRQMTIADLIDAARGGSPRAAGRLLSLVEGERRDEVLAYIRS